MVSFRVSDVINHHHDLEIKADKEKKPESEKIEKRFSAMPYNNWHFKSAASIRFLQN